MRIKEYNEDDLFIERWSPRSFQPNYEISEDKINKIFSAAKWSPSCFNEQPWRFVIAKSNTDKFEKFLDLLVDDNKTWAKDASVLGFILTEKNFSTNGKENKHSRFDAGAAWMSLSLQARKIDLYTHAMAGIKYDKIRQDLNLSDDLDIICGFVIGKKASPESLSKDLEKKERPNSRKPLNKILFFGEFNENSNN